MLKGLFIFSLILSFNLKAQSCKRVNLSRDKWALDYKNMPNYDQGETNICYAYTASQMVDFWKRSHIQRFFAKHMTHSSPIYTAYLFKKYSFSNKVGTLVGLIGKPSATPVDMGFVHSAIEQIRKYGMCNEIVVKQSLKKFTQKLGLSNFDFYPMMYYMFSHFNKIKGDLAWYKRWNNQKTQELRQATTKGYCQKKNSSECKEANRIFDKIVPYFVKNQSIKLYDEIFADCKNPENHDVFLKKLPKPTTYTLRPARSVKNSIIKLLDRPNAQPVGIGYCMGVLEDANHVGLNRINLPKKDCFLHASIIIGKRERNGKCEFLLKNTWGEDCSVYSNKWECERGVGLRGSRNRSFAIWMDAHQLSRNIIQYTYL